MQKRQFQKDGVRRVVSAFKRNKVSSSYISASRRIVSIQKDFTGDIRTLPKPSAPLDMFVSHWGIRFPAKQGVYVISLRNHIRHDL